MSFPWHWDHFFDKYPYTDFHELNLDWLIGSIKYWYKRIDYVHQAIATGSEDHNKYYENPHSKGDLIWWNDEFYRLTKDVSAGDDIDCHSLEHISVEDLLDEETAARIAADDAEKAARIAADDAEKAARIAADDALDDRIDKEITDRTNADNNLQAQITSNDSDIANHEGRITTLETCCDDAKKTLADHETRITNNTTNITNLTNRVAGDETTISNIDSRVTNNTTNIKNLTNQINSGTGASGEKDTNTITELTYHEWRGTPFQGNTGISRRTAHIELATKVKEIIAAGGHAELCRVQLYGKPKDTTGDYGFNSSNFLNSSGSDNFVVNSTGESIITTTFTVGSACYSTVSANNYSRFIQINQAATDLDGKVTYFNEDLDATSGDYVWQLRLIYQTATYISVN